MRDWLIEARKKLNLNCLEAAEKSGTPYKTYNAYENGKRNPPPSTAKKIALVLGFDWTRFYEE